MIDDSYKGVCVECERKHNTTQHWFF